VSPIGDMRFQAALAPVLGSPSKLRLLRTLFVNPNRRWTGRELARAARVSAAQAARDLADLADTSVLTREVVGKSYLWQLNASHVLTPILADLFRGEAGVRSELLRTVSEGLRSVGIEKARIFGSVARGEERNDSDVDLFLQVRTASASDAVEAALDRIRTRVWDKFGNPVSTLVYSRSDVAQRANPAFLRTIDQEGLEVLTGE
jgi:predicted nucleotidyltransferase